MKSRAGDRFKFRPELGKRLRELRLKAGLMQAVQQAIRTDVFNVAAPIGP